MSSSTNVFGNFTVETFTIEGLQLVTPKVFGDHRGFFTERFRQDEFSKMGLPSFIQENYSRSQANVLRGLHFQYAPTQGKLVSVTRGRVVDVAVDIRHKSPTFGQHQMVELNGDKPSWFWVPAGFAHGFFVLSEEGADLLYKVDNYYNAKGEGALLWNDPDLKIRWPIPAGREPALSDKDRVAPSLRDYREKPVF